MRTLLVVQVEIAREAGRTIVGCPVVGEIHLLIVDAPPEPLGENVVEGPPLPIGDPLGD